MKSDSELEAHLEGLRAVFTKLEDDPDHWQLSLLFNLIDRLKDSELSADDQTSLEEVEQHLGTDRISEIIKKFHYELPCSWRLTPEIANVGILDEVWAVVADYFCEWALMVHWRSWHSDFEDNLKQSAEDNGRLVLENIRAGIGLDLLCGEMADCHFDKLQQFDALIPMPKDCELLHCAENQLRRALLHMVTTAYREAEVAAGPFRPDLFWKLSRLHKLMISYIYTNRDRLACAEIAAKFGFLSAMIEYRNIPRDAERESFFRMEWVKYRTHGP